MDQGAELNALRWRSDFAARRGVAVHLFHAPRALGEHREAVVAGDAVEAPAPHPAAEDVGSLLCKSTAIKPINDDILTEHLLSTLDRPEVKRHLLDAQPDVQVVLLDDAVGGLAQGSSRKEAPSTVMRPR